MVTTGTRTSYVQFTIISLSKFVLIPPPPLELIRNPKLLIFEKNISDQDVCTPDLLYFQFFISENAYLTPIWCIFIWHYLFTSLINDSFSINHSKSFYSTDWFPTPLFIKIPVYQIWKTSGTPFINRIWRHMGLIPEKLFRKNYTQVCNQTWMFQTSTKNTKNTWNEPYKSNLKIGDTRVPIVLKGL